MTQIGIAFDLVMPAVNRTPAMMPIVFCASFVPWLRLNSAADASCSRRNHLSTRWGTTLRKSQNVAVISASPASIPISGDTMMKTSVLVQPLGMITDGDSARATAAPAYPPISACEELVGRPKYQVMTSQTIAPTRPAKITANVTADRSIMPLYIVFATAVPNPNAATKLKN